MPEARAGALGQDTCHQELAQRLRARHNSASSTRVLFQRGLIMRDYSYAAKAHDVEPEAHLTLGICRAFLAVKYNAVGCVTSALLR